MDLQTIFLDLKPLEAIADHVSYRHALKDCTTFQLGGACPALITCASANTLTKSIQFLAKKNIPFLLIGGGSNLVISDTGLNQCVIRYVSEKPDIRFHEDQVWVTGATSLDTLAKTCAEQGFVGLNMTTGIPGTVGGAIVGNAGAFGKQAGDVLLRLELIDLSGTCSSCPATDWVFSYRHSSLKESGQYVVSASFQLTKGNSEKLLKEREEILDVRRNKHPDLLKEPCAGSIFRNIEPTSSAKRRQASGWFLEQAGAKGMHIGGAYVYEKHANIIVKGPDCTSQDVNELACRMSQSVKEKFGINLIREVKFLGKFN
ncbi:UDP-N-acetylmuramate dehydrogenase [PVC group bacterium]|nr:UDP-N-acetylmuramate dehydrogenase [PVC group bacterium]